jgi:hypothetical protein
MAHWVYPKTRKVALVPSRFNKLFFFFFFGRGTFLCSFGVQWVLVWSTCLLSSSQEMFLLNLRAEAWLFKTAFFVAKNRFSYACPLAEETENPPKKNNKVII